MRLDDALVAAADETAVDETEAGEAGKARKLREAMFQGNTNDPCLPKQYKVKEIEEIWGLRYASPT